MGVDAVIADLNLRRADQRPCPSAMRPVGHASQRPRRRQRWHDPGRWRERSGRGGRWVSPEEGRVEAVGGRRVRHHREVDVIERMPADHPHSPSGCQDQLAMAGLPRPLAGKAARARGQSVKSVPVDECDLAAAALLRRRAQQHHRPRRRAAVQSTLRAEEGLQPTTYSDCQAMWAVGWVGWRVGRRVRIRR